MAAYQVDPSEVARRIANLSRQPFREQVALMLEHSPTPVAIAALAERSPDRFWQAMAIAARLAGYSDKLELGGELAVSLESQSDAQLLAEVEAALAALAALKALDAGLDKQSK